MSERLTHSSWAMTTDFSWRQLPPSATDRLAHCSSPFWLCFFPISFRPPLSFAAGFLFSFVLFFLVVATSSFILRCRSRSSLLAPPSARVRANRLESERDAKAPALSIISAYQRRSSAIPFPLVITTGTLASSRLFSRLARWRQTGAAEKESRGKSK